MNTAFDRILGDNQTVKDNFVKLIEDELLNSKYPMFVSKEDLLDNYPTLYDAINDYTLYFELENSADKNDFYYKAFYNVVDLVHNRNQVIELVYTYLLNRLI